MTKVEWMACSEPLNMLEFLGERASRRKRQLFALACFEQAKTALEERPPWRSELPALELLRRLPDDADWMAEDSEQEEAWSDVDGALSNRFWEFGARTGAVCRDEDLWDAVSAGTEATLTDWNDGEAVEAGVTCLVTGQAVYSGYLYSLYGLYPHFPVKELAARFAAHARSAGDEPFRVWTARMWLLADLVREVFTNPFPPMDTTPSWWRDFTALRIAQVIYDQRAFEQMPLLADALEEAGCDDLEVLIHCREPKPHYRGCWLLDALLGKT